MPQRGIPRDVEAFVSAHLKSVAQLEILLLLHAQEHTSLRPHDVAEELRIDEQWAGAEMERLHRHGLFARNTEGGEAYRYEPEARQTRAAVDALAKAFKTHRVAVITAIFATPADSVGRFADAFKLRRDNDG